MISVLFTELDKLEEIRLEESVGENVVLVTFHSFRDKIPSTQNKERKVV